MQKRGDYFREERLRLIMEQLMENKKILVADLATQFNVSPSSIRLDLAELEQRGLLRRTYGGAMLPESFDEQIIITKSILPARQETLKEEKEAISKAAAAF
jgi:DeoR/GlpR family transcriptional regulator of sugar metabolism